MRKTVEKADAKEKLLQAAIKVFADFGFVGASTRQLTAEAGVNISAISYYFGDKRGLYRAVLERIAETVKAEMVGKATLLRQAAARDDLDEKEARELFKRVVSVVATFLLDKKISLQMAQIFLREQMDPTPEYETLFNETMRPMHEMLTRLMAVRTGLPFPSETATLCTHAIIGQLSVFKTHREAALRRLGWAAYTPRAIDKIIDVVLTHTDFVVEGYRRQKGSRRGK